MSLHEAICRIKLPLAVCAPPIIEKIKMFAGTLDIMDEHDGWLPYPDFVLEYFSAVGAKHWADLYFHDGIKKCLEDNKDQLTKYFQSIVDVVGTDPSPEVANEFLCALFESSEEDDDENLVESPFAQFDFENIDVKKINAG